MKILCCFAKYAYGDLKKDYSYEYLNYFLPLKSLYPDTELFDTSKIFVTFLIFAVVVDY